MTEDKSAYLPFFINEPIYVLKEERSDSRTLPQEGLAKKQPKVQTEEKHLVEKEPSAVVKKATKPIGVLLPSKLNEAEHAFVEKVLSAVNIALSDVALIDTNSEEYTIESFEKVIDFGSGFSISMDRYRVTKVKSVKIVAGDQASAIIHNVELKKQLWAALKEMFEL
jgi:hypothetical protein